jgi:hypothetical protein
MPTRLLTPREGCWTVELHRIGDDSPFACDVKGCPNNPDVRAAWRCLQVLPGEEELEDHHLCDACARDLMACGLGHVTVIES